MTPLLFLGLSLAGGLGSAVRFLLDGAIRSRTRTLMPIGTIAINCSGSLLLGLLTGLVSALVLPETVGLLVGVGFLGGYTTFSTASFEVVRLLQERKFLAGGLTGFGVVMATTALAGVGLWLGSSW